MKYTIRPRLYDGLPEFEALPDEAAESTALRLRAYNDGVRLRNRRRRDLWAGLLLAVAVMALAWATLGCKSTPDRIAFNSLQTIKASAESSLRVAAALYNAGEIRQDQWDNVVSVYRKTEQACKTAAAGLAMVKTSADAEAFAADARVLLAQLQALVASLAPKKTACMGGVAWAVS